MVKLLKQVVCVGNWIDKKRKKVEDWFGKGLSPIFQK
jgi:hypothetical protein